MQPVKDYTRYCPDQPKALISDAVCVGRRRARYAACSGCQFNDDERGGATASLRVAPAPPPPDTIIAEIFKGDVVVGKYPEGLNEELAWRLGHATASYLRGELRGMDRGDADATSLLVGRDTRAASAALCAALIDGARSTGAKVIDLGTIDTPRLYYALNRLPSCGGVQTTGGSRPADYSGFLIVGKEGRAFGSDTGLADISRIIRNMVKHDTGQQGPLRSMDLTVPYRRFLRDQLDSPRPLRIVVDALNGLASRSAPLLLDGIPQLEVIYLNCDQEKPNGASGDPCESASLAQARDEILSCSADFGVCFDGDADRLRFLDEKGQAIDSDLIIALLAGYFLGRNPGSTVVYDLRCSRVVNEEIKAAGGVPRRERAGRDFMTKALTDSHGVFAGDIAGRFYFEQAYHCESALLALAFVINLLSAADQPLSELVRPLLRYARRTGLRFACRDQATIFRKLADAYGDARVDFLDGITVQYEKWWFNLRNDPGTNELVLVLEAAHPDLLADKTAELSARMAGPIAKT